LIKGDAERTEDCGLNNNNNNNKLTLLRVGCPECRRGEEGKSLTISQLEKAGVAAHTQQPVAEKLVKVVVGGKLHRRGGKAHFPREL
jgi:hypothetical protein